MSWARILCRLVRKRVSSILAAAAISSLLLRVFALFDVNDFVIRFRHRRRGRYTHIQIVIDCLRHVLNVFYLKRRVYELKRWGAATKKNYYAAHCQLTGVDRTTRTYLRGCTSCYTTLKAGANPDAGCPRFRQLPFAVFVWHCAGSLL